jgi:putative phosphoesterase
VTKIGLLSDSHNYLDDSILEHFKKCDEIWHVGDFGTIDIAERIIRFQATQSNRAPVLRGVYGNIDGYDIRSVYPEKLFFTCEEVNVYIQHIGGYPKRYAAGVKQAIITNKCKLFISGHSHILKIMYDKDLQCLHMNPGAVGKQGLHKIRTMIRFAIDGKEIKDCEVIEMNRR